MRLWDLPGARRFVDSICNPLRGGSSVVVVFPGSVPDGFETAVTTNLGDILDIGKLTCTASPLRDLAQRYATNPDHITGLPDLCDDSGFQGRLVKLHGLDASIWPTWRDFLRRYAEASRLQPLLGRSLFLVLLSGFPPPEPPPAEIALAVYAWDGVLDDIDLILFAAERLREREDNALLRSLLATTVARVAAWDFDAAAAMVAEDNGTIMNPHELLRAMAADKSWAEDTPLDWRIGTASKAGVAHPARAVLDEAHAELDRRLWSAQLSVLLPWIEMRRHSTVADNLYEVKRHMRADGDGQGDPFALELGDLARLFDRRGVDRQVRKTVRRLRDVRNKLAHRRSVPHSAVLDLIAFSKS